MARKSQWAQFAENFKSTYDITRQVQQGYATKQVMDDEKFMSEDGGAGYGLKGDELERARYKALGNIATKYGDTAGGLANRTALAELNSKDRDNRIDANNEQYTTALRGLIAQNAALANINNTKSNTGLNNANTNRVNTMTPEMVNKMRADTSGVMSEIENRNAETTGLKLKNASTRNTQQSADDAAIAENNLKLEQFKTDLTNVDLRDEAQAAQFRAQAAQFDNDGATAELALMETYAFTDYANRVSNNDFAGDMDAAKDAYLSAVATFNPMKASEMSVKYGSEDIARIANDGITIQNEVSKLLQTPGPDGLNNIKAYFDDKNGDDVGVKLEIDPETGAVRMFETDAEGTNIGDLFTAANETEARSQIQSLATYGNATAYAEQLFSRTVNQAGLSKTDAETTVLTAQADNLGSEGDVNNARIEKMDAEIAKINNQVENSDQAKSETVRQEGLQRFLGGDTYAYMQADNPEGAKTLLQTFKYQTGMLGERDAASYEYQTGMLNMAALNQGGVSLEQYLNMSPEDRAQFDR
jgi:ribosomal protein S16